MRGVRAVLFDMDGTLIRSDFDWPAIRQELGVEGPSIIDALNALAEPQRSESWTRLEAIERQVCIGAVVVEGAEALLGLLRRRGLVTALVTNNSRGNTESLLSRFHLEFDTVITRDSGLYKPSGAPLVEAMRRLGAAPDETIAIGDSNYDLRAAREAGCRPVIIVNGGCSQWGHAADLAFEDLGELAGFFEENLARRS